MTRRTQPHASDEPLRAALQQVLQRHFGEPRQVVRLDRHRSLYSSSYAIENLSVHFRNERRLELVLKDLSPGSMLSEAQGVRPGFLCDPLREIETYRHVLNPQRFDTPIFYGAMDRPETGQYWLFLERVKGPLLWQVGDFEAWRNAARWMARWHAEFDRLRGPRCHFSPSFLLQYDRRLIGRWLTRAERLLMGNSPSITPAMRGQFSRLLQKYDRVIDYLLALPQTVIHGEFYPSNVILRAGKDRGKICPIDWEAAAIGPGLIDLAALTSGDWTEADKQKLVAAYREGMERAKGFAPSVRELLEAVGFCQLHLCIQWLGWSRDWSPPKSHARNWLRETLRLERALAI
jgi:hypothetical protein